MFPLVERCWPNEARTDGKSRGWGCKVLLPRSTLRTLNSFSGQYMRWSLSATFQLLHKYITTLGLEIRTCFDRLRTQDKDIIVCFFLSFSGNYITESLPHDKKGMKDYMEIFSTHGAGTDNRFQDSTDRRVCVHKTKQNIARFFFAELHNTYLKSETSGTYRHDKMIEVLPHGMSLCEQSCSNEWKNSIKSHPAHLDKESQVRHCGSCPSIILVRSHEWQLWIVNSVVLTALLSWT